MSTPLLELRDLRVSFHTYAGRVQAVRGVSLTVDPGETLAIVGESGCGKSVTVQTVMGLLPSPPARIEGGSILFAGKDITHCSDRELAAYRGKEFSMIFQDSMTSLNPTMRVGRQLCEGILRHQKLTRAQAEALALDRLRQVGIPDPEGAFRRYPHTMSGGQRQRVMIAMAMAASPKLLFADEPTTALDVTMQAQILDLMNDLKTQLGTAVVLITHDLGVVARMADRIAVMYAGEVVEYGEARQVFYNPCHPYTWGLLGAMPNLVQERKHTLYSIPGTPPDLYAPPPGCAFAARCGYAMGVCLKAAPESRPCSDGHTSRCWLMDERAAEVTPPEGVPTLPRGGKTP